MTKLVYQDTVKVQLSFCKGRRKVINLLKHFRDQITINTKKHLIYKNFVVSEIDNLDSIYGIEYSQDDVIIGKFDEYDISMQQENKYDMRNGSVILPDIPQYLTFYDNKKTMLLIDFEDDVDEDIVLEFDIYEQINETPIKNLKKK